MRKLLEINELAGRFGLAASLVISLAALGCSTNTHDGVQTNEPAPAVLRGASLTSSPGINSAGPASMITPSTDALAIAAANANRGGRVLGTVEVAGPSPSGNYTAPTGQVIPPSMYANPEITVNSSISSPATPVITGGAGDAGVIVFATPGTSAGVTAAATTAAVNAAPVFTTAASVATPATAANVATVGQFAAGVSNRTAGSLNPTISSASIPSPLVAANPPVGNANRAAATTTTTSAASTAAPVTATPVTASATMAAISSNNNSAAVASRIGNTTSSSTTTTRGNIAPIVNTPLASALATGMTSSSVSNVMQPATTSVARQRAVKTPANGIFTQPATVPPARQRAVRITTTANGSAVVTNTDSPAFMQRVRNAQQKDQSNPNQ